MVHAQATADYVPSHVQGADSVADDVGSVIDYPFCQIKRPQNMSGGIDLLPSMNWLGHARGIAPRGLFPSHLVQPSVKRLSVHRHVHGLAGVARHQNGIGQL